MRMRGSVTCHTATYAHQDVEIPQSFGTLGKVTSSPRARLNRYPRISDAGDLNIENPANNTENQNFGPLEYIRLPRAMPECKL